MAKLSKAETLEHEKAELFNRQKAYQECFKIDGQMAKIALEDLAKFCREKESCFHLDPRAHALMEGRREVMLRIRMYLDTPSEELYLQYLRKAHQ